MKGNYYRFAKINENTWEGYGPGRVTTFSGEDAKTIDTWANYVARYNKRHHGSPIDRTEYINFMISETW